MAMSNKFRIWIAIMTAFGAFFAYACRLNLSLVINEMVIIEPTSCVNVSQHNSTELGVKAPATESNRTSSKRQMRIEKIGLEEQAIAELSSGRPWWISKESCKIPISNATGRKTLVSSEKKLQMFKGKQVETLSVDFDLNDPSSKIRPSPSEADVSIQPTSYYWFLDPLPKLNWSEESRDELHTGFFLGYVVFQIPAARAAEIFGAKALILLMGLGTGLSSILFVLSTRLMGDSIWCAYLVRVCMGISQAGLFPAIYVLFCQWLPKNERSYWLAVPSAMGRFGTIAISIFAPIIVRLYGWPMVFFVSGFLTIIWSLIFLIFASSSPSSSRWLSEFELSYLNRKMHPPSFGKIGPALSIGSGGAGSCISINDQNEVDSCQTKTGDSIDWLKVIKNRPIMLLTLVMFSSEWSNMLLLVKLAGFLGPAMRMELEEIGIWTSLLVAVYCVQYPVSGAVASKLDRSESFKMSSLNVRKLFEALAHLLQAFGCLLIGCFYNDKTIVLIALFIMMLGRSTVGGGQCLMPPEISKSYPGTVMAYANSLANLAGFFGPKLICKIVDDQTSRESWRPLWFLSTGLFLICGLLFVLLADNSQQDLDKQSGPSKSISQVQLTLPPYVPPPHALEQVVANREFDDGRGKNGSIGSPRRRPTSKAADSTPAKTSTFAAGPSSVSASKLGSVSSDPDGKQQHQRRSPAPPLRRRI